MQLEKGSYMKSIGISIIMAQSGFFVSARKFKFNPYKYLFTVYLTMIIFLKDNLLLQLRWAKYVQS